MRVTHVIPSLALDRGGPSRSVFGLAMAQDKLEVEVNVVYGGTLSAVHRFDTCISFFAAPVLPLPFEIPGFQLVRALQNAIRLADIVHLHSVWNGVITIAGMICRRQGIPMILSPRGMLDQHNMQRHAACKKLYLRLIEARNLNALSGFHFLDETERKGCSWLGKSSVSNLVQPNGLDYQDVQMRLSNADPNIIQIHPPDTEVKHLVYLGRLNVIKGLEMQLEVLADLKVEGIAVHLHFIGPDDGEGGKLKQLADRLGISMDVHFHGPIYGDARLRWLREADAVLLTSHYECNSNTAAETFAVGGVLVATETCHLDLPAAAGGAVVVPRSREAVTKALIDVLRRPERAETVRTAAAEYARSYLDWQQLAASMIAFYRDVIGENA